MECILNNSIKGIGIGDALYCVFQGYKKSL